MFQYLNKGISTPIAISIIVLAAIIFGGSILFYQYQWLPKEEAKNIECTMDAKLCPDGSYVGRTGPNCEFVCPVQTGETVNQQNSGDAESYTACGCGCCGGAEAVLRCLYHSKGDDIQKIVQEDRKQAQNSICPTVGCSQPIKYVYCD